MTKITNLDIYDKVLDVKNEVILLREHVNDRSEAMEKNIRLLTVRIDEKADKTALLTSIVFHFLTVSYIRWGVGALSVAMAATISRDHWLVPILRFLNLL